MNISTKPRKRGYLCPWDVLKLKSNKEVKRAKGEPVATSNGKDLGGSGACRQEPQATSEARKGGVRGSEEEAGRVAEDLTWTKRRSR